MDPSKDQSAINLPLERLVAHALSELEKLRYSRRSLRRYRTVWRQLVAFSHEIKLEDKYSEDLATRFSNAYQIREGECLKSGERMRELAIFADFLRLRDTTILNQLQPADLSAFVTSQHRLTARTVSRIVSDVRSFLQFLLLRGILQRDLSPVLPTIRVPQHGTIPSVWDPQLLVQLLNAVDRSSPKGKRDYAILLLAC